MSQQDNHNLFKEAYARYAVAIARPLPPGKITFEQFLAWADEDTLAEWVEGEVVLMTPASLNHQRLAGFLLVILREFVITHDLGEVLFAPFLVRLPEPLKSAREPDLIFVAKENSPLLKPTYLDGAPDLVVEITSLESLNRDRHVKFTEYEQAGVKEYWLIHPDTRDAEFFQLHDGQYRQIRPDEDGVYTSRVLPGFSLKLDELWEELT
ncbi:Uma2 family endonuclease [Moorella sulfitireducens]|uniref:Uma2 family endonuclease n=1 Tax=Neomoorella sulfitireducens TaxID=2972948 RepID=UPI0021AD46D3|nr:Uma2 family endonuclease [Moorella sulfitireducens]